jgi:hypothetical protein
MVEAVLAGEHFLAGLRVQGVVQGQQQASVGQWIRDAAPQQRPDPIPGQLGRRHEGVEARLLEVPPEHRGEGAQQVRGPRGSDRQQDRLHGEQEPLGALLAMFVRGEKVLDLAAKPL